MTVKSSLKPSLQIKTDPASSQE